MARTYCPDETSSRAKRTSPKPQPVLQFAIDQVHLSIRTNADHDRVRHRMQRGGDSSGSALHDVAFADHLARPNEPLIDGTRQRVDPHNQQLALGGTLNRA